MSDRERRQASEPARASANRPPLDIERGSAEDVRASVGVLMVASGFVSTERGAELAGLSLRDFEYLLDLYDAPDPRRTP